MRRRMAVGLVLLTLATGPGCFAAWWQQLKDNPVGALQNGVGVLQTALGLAQAGFEIWAAANGDGASAWRVQFNHLVGNVERGIMVANSGLRVAADLHGAAPDPGVLVHDAQAAMTDLNSFLAGLPGGDHGAAEPTMLAALRATDDAARWRP